jgi:hypothetical protein
MLHNLPIAYYVLSRGYNTASVEASAWFDGSADYLSWTPSADGNRRETTLSFWVQRTVIDGTAQHILSAGDGTQNNDFNIYWNNTGGGGQAGETLSISEITGGGVVWRLYTSRLFRDTGWYHIVLSFDVSQATASERIYLYVNGERVTDFASASYPAQNVDIGYINDATYEHRIARNPASGYTHMYAAQFVQINGQCIQQGDFTIDNFREAFTAGTNGVISASVSDTSVVTLANAGNANCSFALTSAIGSGTDASTHSNNWTANSMSQTANGSSNTPSNVHPVFTPLAATDGADMTLSNGNRTVTTTTNSRTLPIPFGIRSGMAVYFEVYVDTYVSGGGSNLGITAASFYNDAYFTSNGDAVSIGTFNGSYLDDASTSDTTSLTGTNVTTSTDVWGFCVDYDNGLFWAAKNNTWADGVTPSIGGSGATTLTFPTGDAVYPFISRNGSFNETYTFRFAEDEWSYTPPTGFTALNSATQIAPAHQGSDYFNALLWTGNGSTQTISGAGFEGDLFFGKGRSLAEHWSVVDRVRGLTTSQLFTSLTSAEVGNGAFEGATSDGFNLDYTGTNVDRWNANTFTYVGYVFKAGGAGVTNNDGSITSTISVAEAGHLSIIGYTGNATSGATIGHGLLGAPGLTIHKERDNANGWIVGSDVAGWTGNLRLDTTDAFVTDAGAFNNTAPSSTVITLGSNNGVNRSGGAMIAYAFRSVPGVCKIGSYGGISSADGPYVDLGFRPRWLMIKRINSADPWNITDTARNPYNVADKLLTADSSGTEATAAVLDVLSTGFKIRLLSSGHTFAGSNYLYIAMADVAGGGTLPPIPGR